MCGTRLNVVLCLAVVTFAKGDTLQCEKILKRASLLDKNTVVDTSLKTLAGTWISEGCETRPGPEYVLRHYTFEEDGSCKLIQHHYWDDSCSSPKITITSMGYLKTRRDSDFHNDALGGYWKSLNITIVPQDFKAAKELDAIVSLNCPGQYWRSWRRYEPHLIYSNSEILPHRHTPYNFKLAKFSSPSNHYYQPNTHRRLQNSSGDISCLGSLQWVFNEIKLIKVQLRPNSHLSSDWHWELLLGDIPSRESLREFYIPTAFQTPLNKVSRNETVYLRGHTHLVKYSCSICPTLIASSSAPPHLIKKPHLPAFVEGDWVSERCEVRPSGLYLTRKFSFEDNVWIGEHKFFADPLCAFHKFTVTAAGSFVMHTQEPSNDSLIIDVAAVKGATNIDFRIERASLLILDQHMVHFMSNGRCGEDPWQIGVLQELGVTNGCLPLGIFIPSVQYDIVKVDMSYEGSWMLFLGQPDTENLPRSERPTAFQPPLIKCGNRFQFGQFYGGRSVRSVGVLWIILSIITINIFM